MCIREYKNYFSFLLLFTLFTIYTLCGNNNSTFHFNINVQPVNSPQHTALMESQADDMLQNPSRALDRILRTSPAMVREWATPLCCILAGGYYMMVWLDLYKARALLDDEDAWSSWKHHCTVEHLAQQPPNEICDPLLIAIQERYIDYDDPANSNGPLAAFLPAINREIMQLQRYCVWAKILLKWYGYYLLPIDEKNYRRAQETLSRLRFLKKMFIQWWAAHNTQEYIKRSIGL
jgi:hypothetical protein